MSINQLITELKQQDIQLYLDGEALKIDAPKGRVTSEIIETIKAKKAPIVTHLKMLESMDVISPCTAQLDKNKLPLSFAQKRLWLIDRMEGASEHYNMSRVLEVEGQFDTQIANRALQQIVQRHEILRSIYFEDDGQAWQKVNEDAQIEIGFQKTDAEGDELTALLYRTVIQPFDLTKDLMVRADLIETSSSRQFLILNIHHIAGDGFSISLLIEEFVAIYEAMIIGDAAELPKMPIQYADYAYTQQQWMENGLLDEQIAYWKSQLEDLPLLHQFPIDFPRPARQTNNGIKKRRRLSQSHTAALRKLSEQTGATMFMLLHAAFAVFIARYSGQSDVVIGTPAANRKQQGLESLIGMFVNTLVLRTTYDSNLTFFEFLEHVKQVNVDAQVNQYLPFDEVLATLNIERNLAYNPAFQIMFSMDTYEASESDLKDVRFTPVSSGESFAKFDLELDAIDEGDTILFELVYNTDLFDFDAMERVFKSFEAMVIDVSKSPQKQVSELTIIDPETAIHVMELSCSDSPIESPNSVLRDFESWAEASPNARALTWVQNDSIYHMTYQQLESKSNQLANYFIQKGLEPGDIVALCLPRSEQMVVAMLATLKAGAAYTPIDPDSPANRIELVLKDSQPALLITNSVTELLLGEVTTKINLDKVALENQSTEKPKVEIIDDSLAYLMYTSGSTGVPKGVMIEHDQLNHYVAAAQQEYQITSFDNVLQFSSFSFDISIEECFVTLSQGAALVLRDERWMSSVDAFWSLCHEFSISVVSLPTAFWHQISRYNDALPKSMRIVIIGGEAVNLELVNRWFESAKRPTLINTYGPTETTVVASSFRVTKAYTQNSTIPIGVPFGHVQTYVVDEKNNILPQGVTGELLVAGSGVARGYLNRPADQTARFVTFQRLDGTFTRGYKTGDLANFNYKGELEYAGRIDNQVKIRGYRVELSEIEVQLTKHKDISQAVVTVDEQSGQKRIVAYFVSSTELSADAVTSYLAEQLPEYMVPSALSQIASIPLTTNGKVDYKSLPKIQESMQRSSEISAPETPTEKQLAKLWAQLLQVEFISRFDNFFKLGGHSLTAIQLVSEINQTFNIDLSVQVVFEQKNLAGLANAVEDLVHSGSKCEKITPCTQNNRLPLSFAQQRLWFIDQLESGSTQYNMPLAMKVSGEFNIRCAEQALSKIVERHQVLRTVFKHDEAGAWQEILKHQPFQLNCIDLTVNDDFEPALLTELIEQHSQQTFQLDADVLLKVSFVEAGQLGKFILFNMHHIASDGWSMKILVDEFITLYKAYSQGNQAPVLNDLPIQYKDYAFWQREKHTQGAFEDDLVYWKNQLAGIPPVHDLPLDFARPQVLENQGSLVKFSVDKAVLKGLKQLAQDSDCSLFMIMHAALSIFVARHSQAEDIVIGTPSANRLNSEIAPLIGFFINMIALRTDYRKELTLSQYLEYVKGVNVSAQAHQSLSFEMLVEALQPERSASYSPIFQIALSVDTIESQDLALEDVTFDVLDEVHTTAQFDLTLDVSEAEHELELSFEFNTQLYSASTVEQFADRFATLLTAMASPDFLQQPLSTLPVVSAKERQFLLCDFNDNERAFPKDMTIHDLIDIQSQKTPMTIALVDGDKSYTYQEVNELATRVAVFIIDKGWAPETFIAISMERTVASVVTVLGILKAGLAYVPIDDELPNERIAHILTDSAAPLVIVDHASRLIEQGNTPVITIDEILTTVIEPSAVSAQMVRSDHIAYMTYTSGTTGKAKGVMVEHQAMIARFYGWDDAFDLVNTPPTVLQMAGLSVDIFLGDIVKSLSTGGKLVLCRKEWLLDTEVLCNIIANNRVTFIDVVPSLLRSMMEYTEGKGTQLDTISHVLVGSEAWHGRDLRRLRNMLSAQARCFNIYGQTESVIDATYFDATLCQLADDKIVPIGGPLSNTQIFVLDAQGELVPTGVVGELSVGGPGLARGYRNLPEMTREKFINNSLTTKGERIYCTGDQALIRKDGTIEFLGRNDHQVKVRGFRVELSEIEARLNVLPKVSAAVVLVRKNQAGDNQLIAYLETQSNLTPEDVRTQLGSSLPSYMIPSAFVCVPKFSITVTGKVDRKALPEPDATAYGSEQYIPPSNEAEEVLCYVWEQALQVERVGVRDNFFSLGGDSILMVKVVNMAKSAGIAVSVKSLMLHQTIETLVANLDGEEGGNNVGPVDAFSLLSESERAQLNLDLYEDAYPLSNLQLGSIYHQLKDGNYHIVEPYWVTEDWHEECFVQALNASVARHEILRTSFDSLSERMLQLVHNHIALPYQVFDLRTMDETEFQQTVSSFLEKESDNHFSDQEIQWRINVFLSNTGKFAIVLSHHHAILDGWSVASLITELCKDYQDLINGQVLISRPTLPKFSQYIAEELQAIDSESSKAYFQQLLSDATLLKWSGEDVTRHYKGELDLSGRNIALTELAQRLRVPVRIVLLAVHLYVLAKVNGTTRTTSSVVGHGRLEVAGSEQALGLYLNTQPVVADIQNSSWVQFIAQVSCQLNNTWAHRHYPVAQIQEDLGMDFSGALFNYVNFHVANDLADRNDEGVNPLQQLNTQVGESVNYAFDILFSHDPTSESLLLNLQLSVDDFAQAQVEQYLAYFAAAVADMIDSNGHSTLATVPLLAQAEIEQLLHWGGQINEPTALSHATKLFEGATQQALTTTAVVDERGTLTYEALNDKVNQLACVLLENAVAPNEPVGVFMEANTDLIVVVLALWKIGATYVPLSPTYPADRIQFMIDDANIKTVLTQESLSQDAVFKGANTQILSDLFARFDEEDRILEEPLTSTEQVAYIIYTSGTTGKPKGVQVTHANLSSYCAAVNARYQLTERDRVLQFSNISFDIFIEELCLSVLSGRTLVMKPSQLQSDLEGLAQFIQANSVSVMSLPTAFWAVMAREAMMQDVDRLTSLTTCIVGGEAMKLESIKQWYDKFKDKVRVLNTYGPTETTVVATTHEIDFSRMYKQAPPIGMPLPGYMCFVVGEDGLLAPIGTPGELVVGGTAVSAGYLNRSADTRARFVEQVVTSNLRVPVYKTGDLVKWNSVGELDYIGRVDNQIKLNGYRIEIGEVESAINKVVKLNGLEVIAKDVNGHAALCAYLVSTDAIDVASVVSQLSTMLPEYMVPKYVNVISSLPITANGKVNHQLLPEPEAIIQTETVVAPVTETELNLAELTARFLNIDSSAISMTSGFFELGGNSLMLIQFMYLLNTEYDICLTVPELIEAQSIGGLAQLVENRKLAESVDIQEGENLEVEDEGWL
ncbi:arthrofactin-type cyclic lipopeptide synthetase C [Pseudoalteromonas ulvae UL12]|uniref:non-ribosomal peptide synthetase n=1 Tax=Pseudoalteromonas ulvae TaxID=107327 RepID=UPI00186B756E|nr:non-ribosomal peptide synthetase [Pseudoalteromonas ulvae]MBE0361899.1 arthrofactin-type cyclic lipopeptide synthetase C [Pseudoalteromonas ulvae UL12]